MNTPSPLGSSPCIYFGDLNQELLPILNPQLATGKQTRQVETSLIIAVNGGYSS